jgi:3-hydroxyisobutyrate dehydrogenase-like beta-hydroxyacid dehydrogenase
MHVGFVGTGNMGRPMAKNILKAGHQMTVFDLRREATVPLEALGARRAAHLPSLAREVRVTLMSLPDARAVEAALWGPAGLMEGARPGATWCSICPPSGPRAPGRSTRGWPSGAFG